MITGFHHFELSTQDPERAIAFYRDVFGMELVSDREVEAGGFVEQVTGVRGARVRIVHLRGYGFNFELLHYLEPRGDTRAREPNHTGSGHLCFVTDDLDAEYGRLRSLGVKIRSRDGRPVTVVGGPNDGGKALYAEDPDGNPVELVQLVRPWPGEHGTR